MRTIASVQLQASGLVPEVFDSRILVKTLRKSTANLRHEKHSVSRLLVHLVFVVKYRRPVIDNVVWAVLQSGFQLAAARLQLEIVELNHDRDHAHLVVEYPPKQSISSVVNALKGNSSFLVRRECGKQLAKDLWGDAFWTPSYFAASCGGAPLEILKTYVQSQGT